MLTLTAKLTKGALQIRSGATDRLLAHKTLAEGHDTELSDLKGYLRQYVFNSAVITLDGQQVGTWSV